MISRTTTVSPGATGPTTLEHLLRLLGDRPISLIHSHDAPCCRQALAWFRTIARAASRMYGPEPRWLSERWTWGPTRWPLAWCEAVRSRELDCGALAHMAAIAFAEVGREVARLQLLERCDRDLVEHWAEKWRPLDGEVSWIWDDLVYHEEVGVLEGGTLRLWNPSEGCWRLAESPSPGQGILAMRVHAAGEMELRWGVYPVAPGRWITVG